MKRCGLIYLDLGKRHICRLATGHIGACRGHETSEDLIPPEAIRRTITFRDEQVDVFVWESEIKDVFLIYAPPPHDVMTQGMRGEGVAGAVSAIIECLELTAQYEEEFDVC